MKITIYSTPICHKCNRIKEILTEKGIEFTDINVFENRPAAKEASEKSGQIDVPIIDFDGKFLATREELEDELESRGL